MHGVATVIERRVQLGALADDQTASVADGGVGVRSGFVPADADVVAVSPGSSYETGRARRGRRAVVGALLHRAARDGAPVTAGEQVGQPPRWRCPGASTTRCRVRAVDDQLAVLVFSSCSTR